MGVPHRIEFRDTCSTMTAKTALFDFAGLLRNAENSTQLQDED